MNAQDLFCPNSACPASGHVGRGNLWVHDRRRERYRCTVCRRTFTPRTDTPLAHLRTPATTVSQVVTLVGHGCPIPAIEAAFALDRRTVRRWVAAAGQHAERIHQHYVLQPRDLQHVQADEVRVRTQAGIVWMAMAVMVTTRLWLGGVVSPHRDRALITALLTLVQRSAQLTRRLLLVTDGFQAYATATTRVFRQPRHRGQPGRPRLRAWPGVVLVQVTKMSRPGVWQPWSKLDLGRGRRGGWVLARIPACQVASTAAIERLNGTFRARCAALARRSRQLVRQAPTLTAQMYLVGVIANFCTIHATLGQTPALAAGITTQRWTMDDVLRARIPPPPWRPPVHRGPLSKEERTLQEQWWR